MFTCFGIIIKKNVGADADIMNMQFGTLLLKSVKGQSQ